MLCRWQADGFKLNTHHLRRSDGHCSLTFGCDAIDFKRVLGLADGGWLSGQSIDTYAAWLMMQQCCVDVTDDLGAMDRIKQNEVPAEAIYFNTATPMFFNKFDAAGMPVLWLDNEFKQAVRQAKVLMLIDNIDKCHWCLYIVDKAKLEAVVYEPSAHVWDDTRMKAFLAFLSKLTGESVYDDCKIKIVYGGTVGGFPKQPDSHTCGIFACIILTHFLLNATLNLPMQASALSLLLKRWRKFIAYKSKTVFD